MKAIDGKEKYKIAIVDDEETAAQKLTLFCERYGRENGILFDCRIFSDGVDFLDGYSADYDAVFMDIDMKICNGIKTAEKLREKDKTVTLVFVTNLAQYATSGYRLNASDYIVKPYEYAEFAILMRETLKRASLKSELVIKSGAESKRVSTYSVLYVEAFGHKVVWHTDEGDEEVWSSLTAAEKLLPNSFVKCNVSVLVNLARVERISHDEVVMSDKTTLSISRRMKKNFTAALLEYVNRL